MVDTIKRNQRQYQWQKENKERINFTMEKGTRDRIRTASEKMSISESEFIRQAINEKLEKCD